MSAAFSEEEPFAHVAAFSRMCARKTHDTDNQLSTAPLATDPFLTPPPSICRHYISVRLIVTFESVAIWCFTIEKLRLYTLFETADSFCFCLNPLHPGHNDITIKWRSLHNPIQLKNSLKHRFMFLACFINPQMAIGVSRKIDFKSCFPLEKLQFFAIFTLNFDIDTTF